MCKAFPSFFQLVGAPLSRGAWASHPGGFSRGARASHPGGFSCGAQALGTWTSVVAVWGLSSCNLQALERAGSVVVVHGLSCSTACRIFPD